MKCSTDGRLSWLKIWYVSLCISLDTNEFQKSSLGREKKQLTRSQVILTARTRIAINNQLFMTKLLQLPCRSLSPEKGTNLWATLHDHLWLYVIFISTCHQDNSLILNGGSRNILQKALQEIPLKKAKQREKILEKEEKQYKTDSWKRRLN